MRQIATFVSALFILTSVNSAFGKHKSYLVCPEIVATIMAQAVKARGTVQEAATVQISQDAVKRWCYDITMPHEPILHPDPTKPKWVIPYEAAKWFAIEIKNKGEPSR